MAQKNQAKLTADQQAAAKEMGFKKASKPAEIARINAFIAAKSGGGSAPVAASTAPGFSAANYDKLRLPSGNAASANGSSAAGYVNSFGGIGLYRPEAVKMAADYLGIRKPNKPNEIKRITTLLAGATTPDAAARATAAGIKSYNSYNDYFKSLGGGVGASSNKPESNESSKPGTQGYINDQLDAYKQSAQATIDNFTAQQGVLQQQILDMQARNDQNVANTMAMFNDQLANTRSYAEEQTASLQGLMIQQAQRFQQASAMQQQQASQAQAAYEEQRRQAEALARAYVPNMEPTASNLAYGNNRKQEDANLLSSLTMLSPASSVSPYLAGLQIA